MKDKQLALTVGAGGDRDTGQHLLKSKLKVVGPCCGLNVSPKTHVLKTKIPFAPLLRDRPY